MSQSLLNRKNEIRRKFLVEHNGGHILPLSHVKPQLNEDQLVIDLTNFTAHFPRLSRALFDEHGNVDGLGSRLGRGEVLVYFLYDDVELGGSMSSVDIHIKGRPRVEVKCAKRIGEKYTNFMLGIDEVPASLKFFYRLLKLFEKYDRSGKLMLPENFANISRTKLEELRIITPQEYAELEVKYLHELLSGKVGHKKYLFFDTDLGLPFFFGKFTAEMLKIERISGGLTRLWFSPEGFTR